MTAELEFSDIGLRKSARAQILFRIAKSMRLKRRRKLVGSLVSIVSKLEGGEYFSLTARRILAEWYDVKIGSFSYGAVFRPGIFPGPTFVGRYSSIAPTVRAVERNHPYSRLSTSSFFYEPSLGVVDKNELPDFEPLHIGHDVWIGLNAILLPGCRKIGNGAIIGAGAVVTKNVPEFAIVAGTPAKVLRSRFEPDQIDEINRSKWWRKSPVELKTMKKLFTSENPLASKEFQALVMHRGLV